MSPEEIKKLREDLIKLRDACLGAEFDPDGALILSHAIRYLSFKAEGKKYEPPTD